MPRISAERSGAQRDRIIDGASRVFAERGYGPTTVDAICDACGLSKGAVYGYFTSKEHLFLASSERVFERRYRVLAELQDARSGPAVVDALIEGFAGTLLRTEGAFLRLWVEGFLLATTIPGLAELKRTYHSRFGALLEGALADAQTAGALDPGLDVVATAESVMALADGLMLYALVPGLGPSAERVAALLTDASVPVLRQRRS